MTMEMRCSPVQVEQYDGEIVVRCAADSFGWPDPEDVGQILVGLANRMDGKQLILDFGDVDYLSGAALGKLVALHRNLKAKGSQLVIENVSSFLLEIFSVTGLADVFAINSSCLLANGL